jgi:curved DNA-binding protein CbpA
VATTTLLNVALRGLDPYKTLGLSSRASDAEVRAAYRRLVQLHHPDHNGGSAESARRFEAVQDAYAEIRAQRQSGAGRGSARAGQARPRSGSSGSGSSTPPGSDPNIESRLADLERELRAAREQAQRVARDAARTAREAARGRRPDRPSDEELGYIRTDDSISKILSDAASELSQRLSDASHDARVTERVADLFDELGAKLTGEPHDKD